MAANAVGFESEVQPTAAIPITTTTTAASATARRLTADIIAER
jgi:hypothetical protein